MSSRRSVHGPAARPTSILGLAFVVLLGPTSTHAQGAAVPPTTSVGSAPAGHGAHAAGAAAVAQEVPLFADLGDHHRAITTSVARAQAYFDQGLRLLFAFNLEEAQRAFEQAARLDPQCVMCWWGVGMSLGPHINFPATAERTSAAHAAAQRALTLAEAETELASPNELALARALAHRYSDPPPADPPAQLARDEAYATAMREVVQRFPEDLDAAVHYAEAMMDLRPWDLWTLAGEPQPGTLEILATLEGVLARAPSHPGANHLYIHATEASPQPERALAAADRLGDLMPGAGHLVHMPAHTYIRTGRYGDAAEANRRAIRAEQAFVERVNPRGFYLMYVAHNPQFLWAATLLQGRREESLAAARQAAGTLPVEMLREMPGLDFMLAYPSWTLVRFGQWDAVLAEPAPPAGFPYAEAMWHVARGLAQVGKGDLGAAAAELAAFGAARERVAADALEGLNSAATLLAIGEGLLVGKMAALAGNVEVAVERLTAAAAAEDSLRYNEPPDWYLPVRHALGALLLDAGRAGEAEEVFAADLRVRPENGWALRGLADSLRAQGKAEEAAAVEKRFAAAWTAADVEIRRSWH